MRVPSLKPRLNFECMLIKAVKADHHNMKFYILNKFSDNGSKIASGKEVKLDYCV